MQLSVPPGSSQGRKLRLKGKGLPAAAGVRGDQYVRLQVVLPKTIDAELAAFIARWAEGNAYDPRADLMKGAEE